jgi:3-hydroxyisobutyrate dehydrogenase-like beta-hydroxyacid dehydrogenase
MSNPIRTVAFVGLGKMGSAIAENVVKAGFQLVVHNRTRAKLAPLVALGAREAEDPRAAAESADAVVTCLMDDASVRAVVEGERGLLRGLSSGKIHLATTTNSPALATELSRSHEQRGAKYVASPVLGRPDAAAAKRLIGFVSGDREAVDRCAELLASFTAATRYFGAEPRLANSAKLALNYFVISLIDVIGDVYTFCEKSDVHVDAIAGVVGSLFAHPGLQAYAAKIAARDFSDAGFELAGGLKDAELIVGAAREVGLDLPHAEIVRSKFVEAVRTGMRELDWSAITELTRRSAGRPT